MDINTNVIKEPRGMIRIIQLVFAILAFATTTGFDTNTSFTVYCSPESETKAYTKNIVYLVEYPFKFEGQTVEANYNCTSPRKHIQRFAMEFASSAQFFVATGVLSLLYSLGCLVFYIVSYRHYETNPLIPVIDLGATGILTIFWLAGSCAWAAGYSDVKYYTSPEHLIGLVNICNDPLSRCEAQSYGKWASLTISLIFGFSNIFLWGASMWFVFKETSFHKPLQQQDQFGAPQPPTQTNFGRFGDQQNQNQFQQQQQQYTNY